MGRKKDAGINRPHKNRKVIPWTHVKSVLRRRTCARRSSDQVVSAAGTAVVIRLSTSSCHPGVESQSRISSSAPVAFPSAQDPLSKSHRATAHSSHRDLGYRPPQTSSATHDLRPCAEQSQNDAACTDLIGQKSGLEENPCPIIGNFLPDSQRVELYQPETHYPDERLAFIDMAKPLAKHEEMALAALRENLEALRAGRSQAEIGIAAGAPAGATAVAIGRNVANLTRKQSGGGVKGTVSQIPTAARAYDVQPWQLWVPLFHKLVPEEREQLREMVRLFVEEPGARPWLLTGLKAAIDSVNAGAAVTTIPLRQFKR
jgi:hypothetical protein